MSLKNAWNACCNTNKGMGTKTMALKKCVFVLATQDYEPEMCSYTIPNLKAYADKIKADFCIIEERRFPDYPINYERMQIHQLGKGYDWCINIDADFLIHPNIEDFTDWFPATNVGNWWYYKASSFLNVADNPYFKRDGRDYGLVDCFMASSCLTHDVWEPLPGPFSDYPNICKNDAIRRISEFCVSQNAAKYGLKISGMLRKFEYVYHMERTTGEKVNLAETAVNKLKEWGLL